MDIEIMSRHNVETLLMHGSLSSNTAIISIHDNDPIEPGKVDNLKAFMSICFSDIDKEIDNKDLTLFNLKMANEIKDFVDKYKNSVDKIIVHCLAGISRSAAVACVISRYLNGSDEEIFKSGRYFPNRLVYKIMCNEFGLEYDKKLFDKKIGLKYETVNVEIDFSYNNKAIRSAGFIKNSMANGKGIRFVLFTQGCEHKCEGCHNMHTWDVNGGHDIKIYEILNLIKNEMPIVSGVTISGGEPFMQPDSLLELVRRIKDELNLEVAIYTGYKKEELECLGNKSIDEILNLADVIIDGKFEKDNIEGALRYTGSANQRIHYKEKDSIWG